MPETRGPNLQDLHCRHTAFPHLQDSVVNSVKAYTKRIKNFSNGIDTGIQKALKIPQKELRQPKTIENSNNLTFTSTFNPNNPKIFHLVKSGVNTLVENNVNDFKNRLIHAKQQPPNLKRTLTNFLIHK